jgi:transcriptional regulator with XRE-family HTH domain
MKDMAIGERIRYIRNLRGMTQKWLGMAIGFEEKTADVRVAQYESGTRTPKERLINDFAHALDVSLQALDLPDIDSYVGLAHTLFALEDIYGIHIDDFDGELCLRLDKTKGTIYPAMFDIFNAWHNEAEKLKSGEINKEEYDKWRYNYPEFDNTQKWVKVPSQKMSDAMVDSFRDRLITD